MLRQDRFLETGNAAPEDNETIWCVPSPSRSSCVNMCISILKYAIGRHVPLSLLHTDVDGRIVLDKSAVLDARKTFAVTTSPFKLNAETTGVC